MRLYDGVIGGSYLNGIVDGVADGWGSVWDWLSGKTANELNYDTSSKLMALQNSYNLQNWRTQQTEGPSLYRQGLEKAGYNPILAVSGGSSVPTGQIGSVSSSASGSARAGSISDIVSMFSWVTTAVKAVQEIANLQATAANIKADTGLKSLQGEKVIADTALTHAQTDKITREAASIDPKVQRQNATMGNGFVGDLQKLGRNIVNSLGLDYDASIGDYMSSPSAKDAASVIDAVIPSEHSAKSVSSSFEKASKSPRWRHELNKSTPKKKEKRRHN